MQLLHVIIVLIILLLVLSIVNSKEQYDWCTDAGNVWRQFGTKHNHTNMCCPNANASSDQCTTKQTDAPPTNPPTDAPSLSPEQQKQVGSIITRAVNAISSVLGALFSFTKK